MKLNLYKDNNLVKSVDKNSEGATSVTIDSLTPNTDYGNGVYKVSWSNDTGESDKVDVPNFKTLAIELKSLTLQSDKSSIVVGDTAQLSVVFTPDNASNKEVQYKSNDVSVATVDNNGKITANKKGQATITATSGNVTNTVTITVQEPIPEAPQNISVNPSTDSVEITV